MITFLNALIIVLVVVETIAILSLIAIAADLTVYFIQGWYNGRPTGRHTKTSVAKERLRRQKEAEAHEGFFEESYVRGFDANGSLYERVHMAPTEKALEYYREMDKLADEQIFLNTEEL